MFSWLCSSEARCDIQTRDCAGARKFEDGMDITVVWDEDGYTAAVPNELLKSKPRCRLKLIEFYESKIKAVSRKKKK